MATTVLTGRIIRSGSIPATALGGGVISSSTSFATTGSNSFTGNQNINGTVYLTGSLIPSGNFLYDLGSETNSFRDLFISTGSIRFHNPDGTEQGRITVDARSGDISLLKTAGLTNEQKATIGHGNINPNFLTAVSASNLFVQNKIVMPIGGTVNGINLTAFSSSVASTLSNQSAATSSYAINSTIQSQLAGVVSASTQVKPLLPGDTVSSSGQVLLNTVSGTTFSNSAFYFPLDLRVDGTLTAQQINTEYVSSSVIYESGSTKFGDTTDDVMSVTGSIRVLGGSISGSMTGMFSSSTQVDYNSITNKLSGVVSSSTQFNALSGTSASYASTASVANASTLTGATLASNVLASSLTSVGTLTSLAVGGNLGIGTASPAKKLDVLVNTANGNGFQLTNGNNSAYATIEVNGATGYGVTGWANSTVIESVPSSSGGLVLGAYTGPITFQTNLRTGGMTLTQTGNLAVDTNALFVDAANNRVGIGTATPAQTLQVSGGKVLLDNNQAFASLDSLGTSRDLLKLNASDQLEVAGAGAIINSVLFKVLGIERLRLDSSGSLGIGTATPSASLHVSGTMMIQGVIEKVNITGSAPPTTLNVDAISGSVFYLSGSSANNWTINFRGSTATSLNSIMYPGQSMTFAVLVNHSSVGYTASAHQVDGASITPRWQGGTLPSGSGTSTDIYSYTLIKTANAAFNIFAAQTKFA